MSEATTPYLPRLARRSVLGGLAAAGILGSGGARAQGGRFAGREVVSSSFGGTGLEVLQKAVFDWFTETTGGAATQVPLLSAQAFARMRAEAQNPQLDMFTYSGGQERVAKAEGLTQPIPGADRMASIPASLKDADGHWVAWGIIAEGILYRTDKIETPPTSYNDLLRPAFEGHVAFPDITNGYGTDFLVMLARANGGGENDIDPGFAAMKKIAGNATIFRSPSDVQNLFAQGDAWIMPYDAATAVRTNRMGLPIAFATPSEGAPQVLLTACIAKNSKNADMAGAVIDRMLAPESQIPVAREVVWGPSNPEAVLPDDLKGFFPPLDQLVELDREAINANRPAWTERFNREIAR